MRGFKETKLDYFIKLGGSLMNPFKNFSVLADYFGNLAKENNYIIFPGGGVIDNYIESIDKDYPLAPIVHHHLCARAQDQTGLFFYSQCNNAEFFEDFIDIENIFLKRKLAIMLPMKQIINLNVFEMTWDITSDTMSAYFAYLLGAKNFVILTNVDGLYEDISKPDTLIREISATNLIKYGHSVVDACLAPFLLNKGMDCVILNGNNKDNIENFFNNRQYNGTFIYGNQ
jgi:aspartokinase-like uncharacterized kinase